MCPSKEVKIPRVEKTKSETVMTANILKQGPNTWKVQKNTYLL